MKIKIQPKGKNPENVSTSSKFTKFIRLLSNVYILPIEYKNNFKEVKFSLISSRTLISFMVTSILFIITIIWWFVFQWDFILQYFEKSLNVYHMFDFAQMFLLNFIFVNPFTIYFPILFICHIWASFPALSQVWKKTV